MKTFNEAYNELIEASTGKKATWSKTDFDELLKAFLNEKDYVIKKAGIKNGVMETSDVNPIKMFRDVVITRLLTDAGLEKCEAEKIASEYEFKKVDGLYEIISEIIVKYCETGKKFDFITTEDFKGSLSMEGIEEGVKEHKLPSDPSTKIKVKTKKHKVMKCKSKANDWLKEKLS